MKTIGLILVLAFLGCGGEPTTAEPSTWYAALGTDAPTCQGIMNLDIDTAGNVTGDWYCIEQTDECDAVRAETPSFACLFYNGPITGTIGQPDTHLTLQAWTGASIRFDGAAEGISLSGTATFGSAVPFVATRQ